MKFVYKIVPTALMALVTVSLAGCFGKSDGTISDTANFTITIDTSGLAKGESVSFSWPSESMAPGVTSNNTGGTIDKNGKYNFSGQLTSSSFDVRQGKDVNWYLKVKQQPKGKTCTFNPEVGGFANNYNDTTKLTCSSYYTVSATVSGLAFGELVVLNNNSTDPLMVFGDGQASTSATFSKQIAANGSYNVTVTQSPTGKTCTASPATGSGVTANVNVNVTCSSQSFTVGGNITGLPASAQLTLINNGDTAHAYTATGTGSSLAFTMGQAVAYGGSYNVTVQNQPSGETCTVSNGSGTNVQANVTNVAVSCQPITYTIGGAIQGLASGQQVTLNNNGADPLTVTGSGNFTFPTPVAAGSSYNVTIGTQASKQNCIVYSGSGTNVQSNVNSVLVNCSSAAFVSDSGSPVVYSFLVQSDGTLTPAGIGYASLDGNGAGVALSTDKHYLYVAIPGASLIDAFVVGSDDSLTPMATPSVASISGVTALATSPDGKYLFAGGGGNIELYTIGNDGSLTSLGSSPISMAVQGLTVSNDSSRLFAIGKSGINTDVVLADVVIGSGGALGTPNLVDLTGITADTTVPAYVLQDATNGYLMFSAYNAIGYDSLSGGALTSSFVSYNTGSDWYTGIAFNPGQTAFYAGMYSAGAVEQMSWSGPGSLAPMSPASVSTGGNVNVSDLAMTKDGAYLFTTDTGSNVLSEYVVGSGGALTLNSVSSSVMPPADPLATVPPQPYGIVVK